MNDGHRKLGRGGLAVALLLFCSSAAAIPYVQDGLSFSTTGQSIWGAGSAPGFDFHRFLGTTWNSPTQQVGGITGSKTAVLIPGKSWSVPYWEPRIWHPTPSWAHPFAGYSTGCDCWKSKTFSTPPVTGDTRTGAVFTGRTWGKAGFDVGLSADSGTVNADVRYKVKLDLPNRIRPGQYFNLNPGSTLQRASTFNTNFPRVSGSVDAVLGAKAELGGQACALGLGCKPDPAVTKTVGFDPKSLPLVSFNKPANPGQIKVLGVLDPAAFQFGSPIKVPDKPALNYGDVTVYNPAVDTTGAVNSGALTGSGGGNLLALKANLTGLVLNAFDLPAVLGTSVDLGPLNVSYDLVKVAYGPTLKILQDFRLDPRLMVDLTFSHAVNVAGKGVLDALTSPWDALPSISLLDGRSVTVTPHFWLSAMFKNLTTLGVTGDFVLKALQASLGVGAFGLSYDALSLGPVYQKTASNDFFRLPPLYNQAFSLGGFNRITGSPFTLRAATSAVPEPSVVWLLLLGLAVLTFSLRPRRVPRR